MTEDELVRWYHQFTDHEQRRPVCCSAQRHKELDMTERQCQTLFFWAPKSLQMVIAAMKLKDANSLEGRL